MKAAVVLCVALAVLCVVDAVGMDAIKKHRQSKRLQAKVKEVDCPNPTTVTTSARHYKDDANGKGAMFTAFATYANQPTVAPELIAWMKTYRDWRELIEKQLVANGGQITGQMRLVLTPVAYSIWDNFLDALAPSANRVNVGGAQKQDLAVILAKPQLPATRPGLLPLQLQMHNQLGQVETINIDALFDTIDYLVRTSEGIMAGIVNRWRDTVRAQANSPWHNCKI